MLTDEQEKQAEVIAKCVSTEPRHGETWQRIRKDPKNAALSTEEVLKKAVQELRT